MTVTEEKQVRESEKSAKIVVCFSNSIKESVIYGKRKFIRHYIKS